MRYRQDLKVRLQERYRQIYKTTHSVYGWEMARVRSFILETPALKAIIDSANRHQPDLDPARWVSEKFGRYQLDWPASEEGRSKVVWHLINRWADGEDATQVAWSLSTEKNADAALREMTQLVIEPLVDYLQERLGTDSEILYLLERYRRSVELFERERLFQEYESDTKRGEKLYDTHLRHFLFEQGIDYPYSQPASASGLADIVSGLEGDDPLVCEVKLFDNASYNVAYLAQGFNQALQYAQDYGKTTAHLVIFNLSDKPLELPSDGEMGEWPPHLHVSAVTVHLVAIRALPMPSASKQGKAVPIVVARDQLAAKTA